MTNRARVSFIGLSALAISACAYAAGAGHRGDGQAARPASSKAATARKAAPAEPARLHVQVIATYPHDPGAYIQGLVLDGDVLYESTGLEGRSSLRRVDVTSGKVLQRVDQANVIFSEGLALIGRRLVQLTWKNGIAYEYDKQTLERTREWGYSGEGWGACYDGQSLVTSDGSSRIAYRDPNTLAIRREVQVMDGGRAVDQLNELECVDGSVWSNVYQTDSIVRIDPRSGRVTAIVDAAGLLTAAERARTDVLNGIAYEPGSKTFLITGKLWPKMFRVKFIP